MRRLLIAVVAACSLWAAPGAFAATWCGSGESPIDRPDIVTGRQIHAVYAIPADGADAFPTVSQTMASDVASITSWWQGQDPTRIPNFDEATFGSTTCLDISVVRLPEPAAEVSSGGAGTAFGLVASELETAGLGNQYKKYLVFYDGPPVGNGVCGTGGGDFATGPAYAVVWLQGCPSVPTDSIAAHELLHALGALPAGAPHACTPATDPFGVADPGHPCDSPTDILYPVNSGAPLDQLVLDYNHDDYYGHSGSWVDIQDSLWLHRLDEQPVALSVAFAGPGGVVSDLPGLDCLASCTTQWDPGSEVTLSPKPVAGTRLVHWGGACVGALDCSLTLTSSQAVTALFGPKTIRVRLRTMGRGHVACTPLCSVHFSAGRRLTLKARPAAGWKFVRWSGACKGTASTCRPATDFALAVTATFKKKPAPKKKKTRR